MGCQAARSLARLRTGGPVRRRLSPWRTGCPRPWTSVRRGVGVPGRARTALGDDPARGRRRAHLVLDLLQERRVLEQQRLGLVASLAEPLALVREPRAGLLDHAVERRHVDGVALARDALVEEDVELRAAEGRRDLVLHDRRLDAVADDLVALLDLPDAAQVDAHRCVD